MRFVNIHTHHPTGLHIEPASAGIHPWDAGMAVDETMLDSIAQAAIIGETGLDFICGVPRQRQEDILRMQLQLAEKSGKPVILHCVKAFEPMMKILDGYMLQSVIFHGFIGSEQQARQAVGKGYFLSFGDRTFRSPKTVGALRCTPLQNLFLETDDAPVAIEEVYRKAANVKELTINELQDAILDNYQRIFQHQ